MTVLQTHGGLIRHVLRLFRPVSSDRGSAFDLSVGPDTGLTAEGVDPANITMLSLSVSPEAFDALRTPLDDGETLTRTVRVDKLQSSLSMARMGRGSNDGDPVTVVFGENSMTVLTEREDDPIRRETDLGWSKESASRNVGEVPTPDSVDASARITDLDADTFAEICTTLESSHDIIGIGGEDSSTVFGAGSGSGVAKSPMEVDDKVWVDDSLHPADGAALGEDMEHAPTSAFTSANLASVARAIKRAQADYVTVTWGDAVPGFIDFEDPERCFQGRFTIAPRIPSE